MTKEEFDSIVEEQKAKGMSEEDIAKGFCAMYKEGVVDRQGLEGLLGGLGYELTGELATASDEELKERILVEAEPQPKEEAKEGEPEGEPAPAAPKEGKEPEGEKKPEEGKEEVEVDEKEEAMKKFGLRD